MANRLPYTSVECSTLLELLRWRAFHLPDQRAYTFLLDEETEAVHLTYEELDRQGRGIGARLQSLGATGEGTLLLYPPGLEYIAAFFGCLYAGAVAVPVYPPRPNQSLSRLQAILADAQAKVALTTITVVSRIDSQFTNKQEVNSCDGWPRSGAFAAFSGDRT